MKSSMNNVNADMILPSTTFLFAYEVGMGQDVRTLWEGIRPVTTWLWFVTSTHIVPSEAWKLLSVLLVAASESAVSSVISDDSSSSVK